MKNFSMCRPSVNFIYYISVVVFTMKFTHPVFLFISFMTSLMYYVKLTGKKSFKLLFFLVLPLIISVTLINSLTSHYGVTILATLPDGNNLCLEPIVYGFVAGCMFSSIIMWFLSFGKTVSSDKLMSVFSGRFPKIAMLLTMALRFVPLYKFRLEQIRQAQMGMGLSPDDGNFRQKMKNSTRILSSLISVSLESSIETADSMKCRGYGLSPKTDSRDNSPSPADAVIFVLTVLLDCFIIFGALNGASYVLYNPFFRINTITPFYACVFAAYFCLCALPFWLDTIYDCRWKKALARMNLSDCAVIK